MMNYNDKVNSERPRAKASVTLAEIAEFKLGKATIDIDRPVCQLLPRDGQSMIEMTLTPEAYEKWGYDKTWQWYGDTALIAAARSGKAEVVRYLLAEGLADPTLDTCVSEDNYESATKACEVGKLRHSWRSAK